jgi:Gpi18-like mannosyltransferase
MWGVRQELPAIQPGPVSNLYTGTPIETDAWLEPWQRWDIPQYQAIAERGYDAFPTALFTPPLYPFLMKWTALLFYGNTLASGLFVSGIGFLACLLAVNQMVQFEFEDEKDAFRATLYLASFPAAFFLDAAYNESIFLLGAILCLYSARRNKWLAAGLWGAIAAVARTPGTFLVLPLAYAAQETSKRNDWRPWLAPFLTGIDGFLSSRRHLGRFR